MLKKTKQKQKANLATKVMEMHVSHNVGVGSVGFKLANFKCLNVF